MNRWQRRVWSFIESCGPVGATAEEAEICLSASRSTVSARVGELAGMGLIRYAGRKRETRKGKNARVWVVR